MAFIFHPQKDPLHLPTLQMSQCDRYLGMERAVDTCVREDLCGGGGGWLTCGTKCFVSVIVSVCNTDNVHPHA